MRLVTSLLVVASSTILTGCVSSTFNALSGLTNGCGTGATTVNCNIATGVPGAGQTTAGTGSSTVTTNGTTTTTTTTVNTGNTAVLDPKTNDTTIAIEGNSVITTSANPAVSKLLDSPLNHLAANQTANSQIWFDTKTASNPYWPISKTMAYDEFGTCSADGGIDINNPGYCMGAATPIGTVNAAGFPTGTGGHGLNGDYKLYRHYTKSLVDEELQVWTWANSYATQYRDVLASATAPQHQAWSFGGTYTPAALIPTGAVPNTVYTGKFTATATTSNWTDATKAINPNLTLAPVGGKTMGFNNTWSVLGDTSITANWATATMTGNLSPKFWRGVDDGGGLSTVDVAMAQADTASNACYNLNGLCGPVTSPATAGTHFTNWQDYHPFMGTNIVLKGTISTSATNLKKPNQVVGTATLDRTQGWQTSANTNPMFAGFFGAAGPTEVAGAFAVDGAATSPNDGVMAMNNERRAFLLMSGIFHGQ